MTFDEWWNTVCQPAMFDRAPSNEASAFIQGVARSAAEKAWQFSRVDMMNKIWMDMRATEKAGRENAEKQG